MERREQSSSQRELKEDRSGAWNSSERLRKMFEYRQGAEVPCQTEASYSSNNQDLKQLLINGLHYRLGCSEESKDHGIEVKSDKFDEEVEKKVEEEVISILKKEHPSYGADHLNLLRRKEVLELVKEIIGIIKGEKANYQSRIKKSYKMKKSSIYDETSKEYYEFIIQDIFAKILDNVGTGNISEYLYKGVADDIKCAFSSNETLKKLSANINKEIIEINQKIDKAVLACNEKYKEFKKNIDIKVKKWEEEIDDILESSDIIEKKFKDLKNNRIKRMINKFCLCNMKEVEDRKLEVLKDSYELRETITRYGHKTRFDPSSQEIQCFHADDPEWDSYKERMEGLIGKLDAIKEAEWYQDYPKKWRGKLGEYAIKDYNLQEKIKKSSNMEEGKKIKIITKIDSWKKEIEKLYKRYQYHHEAESSFSVYLGLIEDSLRRHAE
jgi:hypothetical protein